MNRRNFIVSGMIGAGALSMFPSVALASENTISLSSIGKGFDFLAQNLSNVAASGLSGHLVKTHARLLETLKASDYTYDATQLVKMSKDCYAVPLYRKPLLGFNSKELALIVQHNGGSKFYILNEKIATEFANLVESFSQNTASHELKLDVASFAVPVKVTTVKNGKETIFAYQNKYNHTVTLKSHKKITAAVIS